MIAAASPLVVRSFARDATSIRLSHSSVDRQGSYEGLLSRSERMLPYNNSTHRDEGLTWRGQASEWQDDHVRRAKYCRLAPFRWPEVASIPFRHDAATLAPRAARYSPLSDPNREALGCR